MSQIVGYEGRKKENTIIGFPMKGRMRGFEKRKGQKNEDLEEENVTLGGTEEGKRRGTQKTSPTREAVSYGLYHASLGGWEEGDRKKNSPLSIQSKAIGREDESTPKRITYG